LQPKDVEREKIAEDIRNYVNRGGTIKTIHHGETALNTRLTKVWAKKILHSEKPKKR
jgi:translation elongation factor EF-Tu-like GTPase